jgi:hypothetical protein
MSVSGPTTGSLSFASPKESNQRKGDPGFALILRFSLLAGVFERALRGPSKTGGMSHMDVVNAEIAGANFCPCRHPSGLSAKSCDARGKKRGYTIPLQSYSYHFGWISDVRLYKPLFCIWIRIILLKSLKP